MRLRYLLFLVLGLLVVACGGGGKSAGGTPEPAGPSGLSATYDASSLRTTLTWTPPSGAFQGYNLEAEVGNLGFQQINTGLIEPSATGLWLTFNAQPSEVTTFQFRLQSVNGTVNSAWSNVATIQTPVLAPNGVSAMFMPGTRAVIVTWAEVSSAATQVRIERAPANSGEVATGPWATLATQPAQTQSFLDPTIQENAYYLYRVTNVAGSMASDPCYIPMPQAIPLFLPVHLTGTTVAQGIQLNWQNVSAAATRITILRRGGQQTPGEVVATLGAQAQAFTDPTASFGYYSYALSITDGTSVGTTASVLASAPNPQGAVTFSPTHLGGQQGWAGAAMRPDGIWALAVNDSPLGIQAAQGFWPQWTSTGAVNLSRNLVQVDGQGWPDLLYFDSDTQNPGKAVLDQVAFDGVAWTRKPLASSLLTSYAAPPDCVWRLDANAGVHALVTTYDTSMDYRIPTASYLHASPAGVALTPLTLLLPGLPVPTGSQLFVDGGNTPHLLLTAPGEMDDCWPTADGTWTTTSVLAGASADGIRQFTPLSTGVDGAWVLATTSASTIWLGPASILALHKVGGIWQPAQQNVYAMPSPSYPVCTGMAQAPDGSRTAALLSDAGVGLVVLVTSGTTWIPSLVAPPQSSGLGIGFDAAGRLHVLAYDAVAMQLTDFHE